ncbi:uncharacterized protein I303_108524 [Kwoniella dejecticola CBS 10117]|uniref:Uncharacterized protein n=1 Tax=Kwoniella dejecticola CBS 10117 TaxID=1296121 RepID=A0A1A5ZX58_9TREE|nr:uncharacterized protein I303_07152 [Kwoniella dejecticola CBS 10117]OBR82393.1 hypothetical protein I303_07152 [Kwoniella dejecticola CBS 10117]
MSSSPWLTDYDALIRDYTERRTDGSREVGPGDDELGRLAEWAKQDDKRKIIMDILKGRLDLSWPANYKALTVLSVMPEAELVGLEEKLGKLADSAPPIEGAKYIKEAAKPLHEKAKAAIAAKDAEESAKKQAAIAAMWGGLWANDAYHAPALQYGGYMGWPYPYAMPPGVARGPAAEWPGKPPEGWSPVQITALPQIYPFSRTGYYALQPEPSKDIPKPTDAWSVYVGVGPKP